MKKLNPEYHQRSAYSQNCVTEGKEMCSHLYSTHMLDPTIVYSRISLLSFLLHVDYKLWLFNSVQYPKNKRKKRSWISLYRFCLLSSVLGDIQTLILILSQSINLKCSVMPVNFKFRICVFP